MCYKIYMPNPSVMHAPTSQKYPSIFTIKSDMGNGDHFNSINITLPYNGIPHGQDGGKGNVLVPGAGTRHYKVRT